MMSGGNGISLFRVIRLTITKVGDLVPSEVHANMTVGRAFSDQLFCLKHS